MSISVRTQSDEIDDFLVIIDLHQDSILSPHLVNLILHILIEHIQELAAKGMLFGDGTVLFTKSNEDLN